ncbi:MAG: hypothetical protein IAF38_00840, partial [Bacteroidia bacterium]|nr:hypothetical protein [Bacteroidia bacterium]
MKKILFFTLLLIGKSAFTQTYVSDESRFVKDTTLVVLEDDAGSAYNTLMKKALQKFWSITPYKFITESVFKSTYTGRVGK